MCPSTSLQIVLYAVKGKVIHVLNYVIKHYAMKAYKGVDSGDSEQNNRLTCLFSKLSLVVPTKRDIAPHEGDETKFEISSTLSFEFRTLTKSMANDNYMFPLYL
jgi:hypothetical protein